MLTIHFKVDIDIIDEEKIILLLVREHNWNVFFGKNRVVICYESESRRTIRGQYHPGFLCNAVLILKTRLARFIATATGDISRRDLTRELRRRGAARKEHVGLQHVRPREILGQRQR